jgi:hypothetical protein
MQMSKSAEYAIRVEERQRLAMEQANIPDSDALGWRLTIWLLAILEQEPLYIRIERDLRSFLIPYQVSCYGMNAQELLEYLNYDLDMKLGIRVFLHQQINNILVSEEPWGLGSEIAMFVLTTGINWDIVSDRLLRRVLLSNQKV